MTLEEMEVMGEKALEVADVLTSTTFKILQLISSKRLDVSTIAEKLKFS